MTDSPITPQPAPVQRSGAEQNQFLIRRYCDWLRVRNLSKHTLRTYGDKLRDLVGFLGARSILDVTHADMLAYLADVNGRGISSMTLFIYVSALRSFGKFLNLLEIRHSGVLTKLKLPKLPYRIGGFHTVEEVQKLIAAAKTPLDLALIEFLFATACRVSEITRIRVEQINWTDRTLKVLGKGAKERIVCYGGPAEVALRRYLDSRTEGFVFLQRSGRPLTVRHIERIVANIGARAGLHTHPHKLRHAAATAMLNHGANIRELQELLGHSSLSTTMRYLHSTTADLLKAHDQFHPHGDHEAEIHDVAPAPQPQPDPRQEPARDPEPAAVFDFGALLENWKELSSEFKGDLRASIRRHGAHGAPILELGKPRSILELWREVNRNLRAGIAIPKEDKHGKDH